MNLRSAASCFLLLISLAATTSSCCALGSFSDWGCAQWIGNQYTNASFDDVYQIAFHQVDRDYDIAKTSDPNKGLIETEWDHGSIAEASRLMQRERVIVQVEAEADAITLKLRVQRQVRERTGLLAPDDKSDEDWSYSTDDFDRARVVFGRIQALLDRGGPSEDFHRKPIDPTK